MQRDLAEYLEGEFLGLYEYLGNGERADEFVLQSYQAMILLEKQEELNKLLSNPFHLEFTEEIVLKNSTVLRIGMLSAEDVQLCYAVQKTGQFG